MSRFLPLSAAAASLAIVFACTQQTSDAQQDTTSADDAAEMQADMPPSEMEMDGNVSLPSMMRATGDLMGNEGDTIGSVNMIEGPNGILMEVSINEGGLTPGWHAVHIHQTGDCSDTGEYTASGGHVGKIEGDHGLLNPTGPEPGDLPNLYAFEDGSVNFEAFTDLVALSDVMDDDGGAIIIHEGRDDHMSQPIGGAGGRVACAVVQ